MIKKTFKYRLYPTKSQIQAINTMFETHRRIYNNALAERKELWEEHQKSISSYDLSKAYKEERKVNEFYQKTNFSSVQWTLRRLDKAFQAFFRRVKAGEKPGYPRFKAKHGKHRWCSIAFTYGNGSKIKDNRLYIQYVGEIKVRFHRVVEGKIKSVRIKCQADRYYAYFTCEVESKPLPSTGKVIGLDLGVRNLIATSDGTFFKAPKFLYESTSKLRIQQRTVSRRKKGSNRRRKAVRILQRTHEYIANQRRDTAHKIAYWLVQNYDMIAIEDLNTIDMLKNHHLAKSISDAGWNIFVNILIGKAKETGRQVVKVDPKNTSQLCSECDIIVKKDLSVRTHSCSSCGLVLDRDVNAARNILKRAQARIVPSEVNVEVVNSSVL